MATLDKDNKKKSGPEKPQQPLQPGMMMWEAGIMYFSDGFDSNTTKPVIQAIIEKNLLPDSTRPKELTLVINSPGGQVHSAFALIDTMKGSAIPVKTVGLGMIASCGLLLFISGSKGRRILTPNTSILSHQFSWGTYGKEHELFAAQKEYDLTTTRMLTHYKKCTGLSDDKIRKYLLPPQDVWLDAKEAKKLGICDEVKELN